METVLEKINEKENKVIIKETKERLSNFELLRIIAMVFIVLHHYAYHGNLISVDNGNINKYIALVIIFGGKLGVNLFVLITGYFQVNSKFKIKKLINLVLQIYFYSIMFFVLFYIKTGKIDNNYIRETLLPLEKDYWFFGTYALLYILSPIINYILKNLSKGNFRIIIFSTFFVACILPMIIKRYTIFNNDLVWFIFIYSIGAYMRLYNINFKTYKDKLVLILGILLIAIMYNLPKAIQNPGEYCRFCINFSKEFIPIVLLSIIIFMCFKGLNIKYNKKINAIAKLSFAVYLFHDNMIFRMYLWNNVLKIRDMYNANTFIVIIHMVVTVVLIYFLVYIIEWIRKIISIRKKEGVENGTS